MTAKQTVIGTEDEVEDAVADLTAEQARRVQSVMLGALAGLVDGDVWQQALDAALTLERRRP